MPITKKLTKDLKDNINKEEAKLINRIKTAGTSAEAVGWLEIIIVGIIFLLKYLGHVALPSSFFSGTILLATSIFAIVLGRRIKALNDINTKNYLVALLIIFIISFCLVIADGGSIGFLGIILLYYLIQGIRAENKLKSLSVYSKKFQLQKHSINKSGWIICIILVIVTVIFGLFLDMSAYNTQATTNTLNTNNASNEAWQTFNAIEDGFKVDFPSLPQKEASPAQQVSGINVSTTTYTSSVGENETYMVIVYGYDIAPSNYNVKNGLEGMVNGFVSGISGASLASSSYSTFGAYQTLDFTVSVPSKNLVFNGRGIIRDDLSNIKAYIILSGATVGTALKHDQFVNSFAFTN